MADKYSSQDHIDRAEKMLNGGVSGVEYQTVQAHAQLSIAKNLQFLVEMIKKEDEEKGIRDERVRTEIGSRG